MCHVGPSSVSVAGAGCGPVFYTPIFMSSLVTTKPRVQARAKLFFPHPGSVMGSCSYGRQPIGARPGRRGRRRTNQSPTWRRGARRGCSAGRACGGDVRGLLNKPISGRRRAFTRLTLLGKWVQQIEPCKRFGLAGGGGDGLLGAALQTIEHSPHLHTRWPERGGRGPGGEPGRCSWRSPAAIMPQCYKPQHFQPGADTTTTSRNTAELGCSFHIDNAISPSFTSTHPITTTNSTTFLMSQSRPQIHSCSYCSS